MRCVKVLIASLALVIFDGCATSGAGERSEEARLHEAGPSPSDGMGIFVEGPDARAEDQLRGVFLPAECWEAWLEEEVSASGEITRVSRPARRGSGPGPRRPPPLLNPRPTSDQLRYWQQRPPDPRVLEQARRLYFQRLTEAEAMYPNSSGYENHHGVPLYLGGTPQGTTYRLRTAYHKLITREFRREWAYGRRDKPNPKELMDILIRVYGKYPIPQLVGIEP